MTRIKICGLQDATHAISAAEAGADFIGFVFAESRRKVDPLAAAQIARAAREAKPGLLAVGVFAGIAASAVNRIAETCALDRVQLSGGEDIEFCRTVERPITRVFHISPVTLAADILESAEAFLSALGHKDVIIMLDSKAGNSSGGTGITFPWDIAAKLAARHPIIVAGGLNVDNVDELIGRARPWGVDVSSGVETGGAKDAAKMRKFIETVKRADDELASSHHIGV